MIVPLSAIARADTVPRVTLDRSRTRPSPDAENVEIKHTYDQLVRLTRFALPAGSPSKHAAQAARGAVRHPTGSSLTITDLDVGVLLTSAVLSRGTRTFVSGK